MGGFKNELINSAFATGSINLIITHLIECSKKMKDDCVMNNNPLRNHEDRISDRLVARYLNVGKNIFRYVPQVPNNFDEKSDTYIGRPDITVIPINNFNSNIEAYFIIECKRIDGENPLNKKYITEGVGRFFNPMAKPKYSPYYMKNIMFGYVVKAIDISDNTGIINKLQGTLLKGVTASGFILEQSNAPQYYVYGCEYLSTNLVKMELKHLFFDFTDAICGE